MVVRICFLSSLHEAEDKRVFEKEARALADAGFDVVHVAPGFIGTEVRKGVRIEGYRTGLPEGLLARVRQLRELYRAAEAVDADVYHCNEVDSWCVGVLLKLLRRVKVVFDVHEHYPSTFADRRVPGPLKPLAGLLIRAVFLILTPATDRIVLAKRTVAADFVGADDRQVLVQNFVPLRYDDPGRAGAKNAELTAIHVGVINRWRGWPQMLDALSVTEQSWRIQFIGDFVGESDRGFWHTVEERGLQSRVEFLRWLPFDQMLAHVRAAHTGLIMFQPGIQNHVFALPHKMFDYMLAEVPVIAPAFATEVAEIVREADCGVLIDPRGHTALAKTLDFLANHPEERQRLGNNGRMAVVKRFNWEVEAEKLVSMYRSLARM
jgi:glycosyltransferase involved in cell wall biosynthesis